MESFNLIVVKFFSSFLSKDDRKAHEEMVSSLVKKLVTRRVTSVVPWEIAHGPKSQWREDEWEEGRCQMVEKNMDTEEERDTHFHTGRYLPIYLASPSHSLCPNTPITKEKFQPLLVPTMRPKAYVFIVAYIIFGMVWSCLASSVLTEETQGVYFCLHSC